MPLLKEYKKVTDKAKVEVGDKLRDATEDFDKAAEGFVKKNLKWIVVGLVLVGLIAAVVASS